MVIANQEKEKRIAELLIENEELTYKKQEKEKRSKELIIVNFELAFQVQEKKNRASELVIANTELAFQNNEKIKKAKELIIKSSEITNQIKLSNEENLLFDELKKTEKYLSLHIKGLERVIFMTSHKIRHPIANILGLVELMSCSIHSPIEMSKQIDYLKQAALTLEECTKELTIYLQNLQHQNNEFDGKQKKPLNSSLKGF